MIALSAAKYLTPVVLGNRIPFPLDLLCIVETAMAETKPAMRVDYADKATVVTLTDEKILEDKDIQALQASILSVVEQAERVNLIIDFQNVRFFSSAVLGLLIRISRRIYEREGNLRLCGIDPKIHEIFRITRLTKVFDIYQDVRSAVENLSGPG